MAEFHTINGQLRVMPDAVAAYDLRDAWVADPDGAEARAQRCTEAAATARTRDDEQAGTPVAAPLDLRTQRALQADASAHQDALTAAIARARVTSTTAAPSRPVASATEEEV